VPPPEKATYDSDPRIQKAHDLITMWNRVAPEIQSMHQFEGHLPTENIHLHGLSFRTIWFNLLAQSPSYMQWVMTQDPAIAYQYEKRVLKLLQWRNPRERWVMKSPFSLNHIPWVLKVYPNAGFIWPHRDPVKAMSSGVSLMGTLTYMRSDHPFLGNTFEQMLNSEMTAGMVGQPIAWLQDGTLPEGRLCNVQYADFVKSPVDVIRAIYTQFGAELTDEAAGAMQRYMDEHPRSGRPAHDYDTGDEQLVTYERSAFHAYQQYFDVPNEL
jgi:hypothetical protein